MKLNRIRLHKMNRNLTWKEVVYATGIERTRLLHLANNQSDASFVERLKLSNFFMCPPDEFLPYSMEVEIEL